MKEEIEILSQVQIGNRVIPIYGTLEKPVFIVVDVAEALGVQNASQLISDVDPDERLTYIQNRSGQRREMNALTEYGLYEVLMLSRKPAAREFKRNVKDILHKLRLDGKVDMTTNAVVKAEPKKPRTPQVSKARLEAEYTHIKFMDELLHIADSSKAMMINQIAEKYDLAARAPRTIAPDVPMSASDLLKKNGINMSAIKFNKIMTEHGFIEVHERKSKSAKSGVKHFPALTEKGLKYGSNVIDPKAQNQTQPLYHTLLFPVLLDILGIKPETTQPTLFPTND